MSALKEAAEVAARFVTHFLWWDRDLAVVET
jgi:hypothetical protein